jgi:hypothetical protein
MGRFLPGAAFREGGFSELTYDTQSQEFADGVPIALDCGQMVNQLPALDAAGGRARNNSPESDGSKTRVSTPPSVTISQGSFTTSKNSAIFVGFCLGW